MAPVFSLKMTESLSPVSRLMPLIAGILGELVDLRAQIVELADQRSADGAGRRVLAGLGEGLGEAELVVELPVAVSLSAALGGGRSRRHCQWRRSACRRSRS